MDRSESETGAFRAMPPSTRLRLLVVLVLFGFGLGIGATMLATRAPGAPSAFSGLFDIRRDGEAVPAPAPAAQQPAQALARPNTEARLEQAVEDQGGLEARVASMERRLARLDIAAEAAAGNATRAEALLVAFAARRAVDRGAPLGYLANQLQIRFGEERPNAVQTIVEFAQNPVTLDQLLARLDGLAPELSSTPRDEGMIDWLGRELSQLLVVRREDTPSPGAPQRLERARLFMASGRAEAAMAEISNLPNAQAAQGWLADAARYAAAQNALDLLETAAVLAPAEAPPKP